MTPQPCDAARLCIFVREPRLGTVKTRLASTMGAVAALAAYERLVDHLVARVRAIANVRIELWVAGDTSHPHIQQWAGALAASIRVQPEGDLGQRMHAALYDPTQPAVPSLVIGTDCPAIDGDLVTAAVAAIRSGAELVLAPAEDGGYGLIAVDPGPQRRFENSPLCGIEWGSAAVLAQTRARCQHLSIATIMLQEVWDVDTESDWQRFEKLYGG
ncbi:MAG: TIGR04282 family arsenosugar biosynthesis glycosyltransferase [Pseudomonadales bacterium]